MKSLKHALVATFAATALTVLSGCGATDSTVIGTGNTGVTGANGACIPLTGQIPFTINGGQIYNRKLQVGLIPPSQQMIWNNAGNGQSVGTVITGGAISQNSNLVGQGVDGQLVLGLTQTNNNTAANNTNPYNALGGYYDNSVMTVNGTGYLQIAPATRADIAYQVTTGAIQIPGLAGTTNTGLNAGYNAYNPYANTTTLINESQICVSGIAISINIYQDWQSLYLGDVFLYLNNTQHGYILQF